MKPVKSEKRAEYQKAVIHRLFAVMRQKYGSYWVILIGDCPITEIKARWQEALKDVTAEAIGKALESVKELYPDRPPTMHQFVAMAKNLNHVKLGHQSVKTFDYGDMPKTTAEAGNGYLNNIRSLL